MSAKNEQKKGRKEMIQSHETLLKRDKNSLPYQFLKKGNDFLQAEDYQQAIECYTLALDTAPMYIYALNNRGCAYIQIQEFHLALKDLHRAIDIAPTYTLPYYSLFKLFAITNSPEYAEFYFRVATQMS